MGAAGAVTMKNLHMNPSPKPYTLNPCFSCADRRDVRGDSGLNPKSETRSPKHPDSRHATCEAVAARTPPEPGVRWFFWGLGYVGFRFFGFRVLGLRGLGLRAFRSLNRDLFKLREGRYPPASPNPNPQ